MCRDGYWYAFSKLAGGEKVLFSWGEKASEQGPCLDMDLLSKVEPTPLRCVQQSLLREQHGLCFRLGAADSGTNLSYCGAFVLRVLKRSWWPLFAAMDASQLE